MDLQKYPTDMDWMPGTRGVNDVFAIGYADGSFEIVTKLGKVEKSVAEAHKGAVNLKFFPSTIWIGHLS